MTPTRRGLLVGLGAAVIAAPAIVRSSSLMTTPRAPVAWKPVGAPAVRFPTAGIAGDLMVIQTSPGLWHTAVFDGVKWQNLCVHTGVSRMAALPILDPVPQPLDFIGGRNFLDGPEMVNWRTNG